MDSSFLSGRGDSPRLVGDEPGAPSLGRYVVLEALARGNGRVLRAYDRKLQREVEIKTLQGDEASGLRDAEVQALAKLSHPNVAAVYDAVQQANGDVVLVMEHVVGLTIDAWLREATPDWRVVLRVFVQAGCGLAAGHEVGLLHGDFGSAHVLVCPLRTRDAAVEARVIGFGGSHDAPERDEPCSPCRDQHDYCVALRDALHDAPIPKSLARAIARGLASDPSARWPSMRALLAALAEASSTGRHRWLVAIGCAAALGLAAERWISYESGAARCTGADGQMEAIWNEGRRAEVQASILGVGKSYAAQAWEQTRESLDGYARAWATMHVEACEATTVRMEQPTEVMDLRMLCLQRAKVKLGAVVNQLASADMGIARNAHRLTGGLSPLSRCEDIAALREDVEPPLPEDAEAVERGRALVAEANAARNAARIAVARQSIDTAHDVLDEVAYAPVRTELALEEGQLLREVGDYEAAQAAMVAALRSAVASRDEQATLFATAALIHIVGTDLQRLREAMRYVPLARGLAAGDPKREAEVTHKIGGLLSDRGEYDAAVAEHRRSLALHESLLGAEHQRVAAARSDLATTLYRRGDYAEAEAQHRQALAVRIKLWGPDHPDVAMSRNNLANVLAAGSKNEQAEVEYRAALSITERAFGPRHPFLPAMLNNLATALEEQGRHDEAGAEYRRGLELALQSLGSEHPFVATLQQNLGVLLKAQERYDEAEHHLRTALAVRQRVLGNEHPQVARTRTQLAKVLLLCGRAEEARDLAERAWAQRLRGELPPWEIGESAYVLSRAVWSTEGTRRDARARARELAERALAAYQAAGAANREEQDDVGAWLAEMHSPWSPPEADPKCGVVSAAKHERK